MKALSAGNAIHSQSQLLFVNKGMTAWLETLGELNAVGGEPRQLSPQVPLAQSIQADALVLLTDMALNTWKEASSW